MGSTFPLDLESSQAIGLWKQMVCVKLLKQCLAHSEQQVHGEVLWITRLLIYPSVDLKISIWHLGQGCAVHCTMFKNIVDFHPLNGSSTPPCTVWQSKISLDIVKCPLGKLLQLRNWSTLYHWILTKILRLVHSTKKPHDLSRILAVVRGDQDSEPRAWTLSLGSTFLKCAF